MKKSNKFSDGLNSTSNGSYAYEVNVVSEVNERNFKKVRRLIILQILVIIISLLSSLAISIAIKIAPPSWASPGEFVIFNGAFTQWYILSGMIANLASFILGIIILVTNPQSNKKNVRGLIITSGVLSILMFTSIITFHVIDYVNLFILTLSWIGLNGIIKEFD